MAAKKTVRVKQLKQPASAAKATQRATLVGLGLNKIAPASASSRTRPRCAA